MYTKERLEQLLAEGKSVTDLLNLVLDEPRPAGSISPLLRRASLVRWFDRPLFEEVLAADLPDAPPWESFIESADVEPPRGDPPRYAVRDPAARPALEAWKQQPGELRSFSARLAAYFSSQDPVEHFTHLVLANPQEAQAEFVRLYRDADKAFDLALCDMLLRTLRHRNGLFPSLIPQTLRDALNDREQYYRSRTLFADDYWRTMAFVERPALVQHFEAWQSDPNRWVLHLYGKGGFGKTMFIRWLIARRCVREIDGRRIPVARLDSDHMDLPALSRWPWLGLLPMAQQLDVQLPGGPFSSLLHGFGDFAVVLRRPSGQGQDDSRANLLNRLKPELQMLADQIPKLFQSGLGQSRVVIVLDTVEELLLHHRSGLQAMLEHLALLREKCPGLQLLLSGRYNLSDTVRLPGFMAKHCPPEDRLLIEGFEPDESLHYLRDLRKVPPDAPLEAIVRKTRGNPFELALFADLAIANPDLTVRDVERYPDTQYARLIERIIERIPAGQHGVAWLLRYAVVPRQLTFEFVRDVLGEYLPKEMTRVSQLDQPNRFGEELAQYSGREVWRKHQEDDLRRIWNQLCRYASDHSWVELKGDVLTLQPEVRVPMRQLLREQEIHPLLQEAAARYFEQCALSLPEKETASNEGASGKGKAERQEYPRWARYMPEALYHRFHLDGIGALERWRQALAARQAKDLTVCARIAEVPLSSDFVDDTGRPVEYPGGPLVNYDLLAEAAQIQAWVLLLERLRSRSFEASAERLMGEFSDAYRRFRLFHKRAQKARISAQRFLILEAAQCLFSDREADAEKRLRRADQPGSEAAEQVVLDYMLARTVMERSPVEAADRLASAAHRAARMADPPLSPEWIDFRLARRLEDRHEPERALEYYQRAWARAVEEATPPAHAPDLLAGTCRILRTLGRWSEAEHLLHSPQAVTIAQTSGRMQFEIAYAKVHLALDRHDPSLAMQLLPAGEDGVTLLLRGIVHRAALQVVSAEELFNQARHALIREGSSTGPLDALFEKAVLSLDALGNVHQAEETLHSIPLRESGAAPERVMLKARILSASGKAARAAEELRSVLSQTTSLRPRLQVLSLLSGLNLARNSEARQFLEELTRLPPSARYPLLEAFSYGAPRIESIHSALKGRFAESLPQPRQDDPDFALRAWLWGLAAPVFGCIEEARDVLVTANGDSEWQPHFQRKLRSALRRGGVLRLPDPRAYLAAYETVYGGQPELWGTALLEEAEYAVAENPGLASELFQRAEPLISEYFPDHSSWVARRHELRARLAEQGQQKRAALDALLTAHRAAVESGASANVGRLANKIKEYEGVASQTHRDTDLLQPAPAIRLELTAEGVQAQLPGGAVVFIRLDPPISGSRSYAAELVERLAYSRDAFLDALQQSFAPLASLPPDQYVEVRTGRGPLASLPWEAALPLNPGSSVYRRPIEPAPIRDTVLMVQQAVQRSGQDIVIDGIYGPQTDALLHEFGPDPREARRKVLDAYPPEGNPQVLIVQRSAEEERFLKRSHGNYGVDLLAEYERRSLDVFRLSDPQQLTTAVSRFRPSLLHLVTAFQESTRTGEIYLDFGDREAAVSASALDGLLRRISGTGLHPFVLVEAILPPDPYDQARQALLRSAFCDELFRFGNTRGVLAAGLAEPGLLSIAVERMADAAARRRFAASLHRDLAVLPMLLPPALFTLDPEIPVLW